MKSFAVDSEANGISAPWQTLGKSTEVAVDGSHAYVAFPTVFGLRQHGKSVRKNAMVTVALEKTGENWSVICWKLPAAIWADQ
jgi:hypothetical protein